MADIFFAQYASQPIAIKETSRGTWTISYGDDSRSFGTYDDMCSFLKEFIAYAYAHEVHVKLSIPELREVFKNLERKNLETFFQTNHPDETKKAMIVFDALFPDGAMTSSSL